MQPHPAPSRKPWHPKGRPHLWLPKSALHAIEGACEDKEAAAVLGVYLGFVRTADAENSHTFAKPVGAIAKLAFVSARTVLRHLPRLETLGLLRITKRHRPDSKERDVSLYEILLDSEPPDVVTECHEVVTPCHKVMTDTSHLGVTVTRDQGDLRDRSNSTSVPVDGSVKHRRKDIYSPNISPKRNHE